MVLWNNDKCVIQEVVGDGERVKGRNHFLDETKTHTFGVESQEI